MADKPAKLDYTPFDRKGPNLKVQDLPEFDPLRYLDTMEAIIAFVVDACESGDMAEIVDALAVANTALHRLRNPTKERGNG